MLDSIRANAQSFGVKLAFGIIIIVFVFWGIGSYTSPGNRVATVNGMQITEVEFANAYNRFEQNLRYMYPDMTPEILRGMQIESLVLQELVERKLLEQEAGRIGLAVSPYEIRQYVESMGFFQDETGAFNKEVYLSTLKGLNQTPGQFERAIRQDLLPEKFRTVLTAGIYVSPASARAVYDYQNEQRRIAYVFFPAEAFKEAAAPSEEDIAKAYAERSEIYSLPPRVNLEYVKLDPARMGDPASVSDAEVARAYEERKAEFSTPEQIHARHILLMVDEKAPEASVEKAREDILALRRRIMDGEDFATVAREKGQDGTAATGGDLGWFTYAQMVPEFADVAFALEPGMVSEPVRTRFGFHLIKSEERKSAHVRTLDEVKEELRAAIAARAAGETLQAKADEVLAAALGGKSMSEAAALVGLEAGSTGLVAAEELGASLGVLGGDVQTIMSAPPGQTLGSVLNGNDGLLVVRVAESLPKTVKPLTEVREDLIFWLTRQKSRELARAEAEKVRASFSDARPSGELAAGVKTSDAFSRNGYIAELGLSPALTQDVFGLPASDAGKNVWLADAYEVDEGAVLAALAEVVLPADDKWAEEQGQLLELLERRKADELFLGYKRELAQTAEIRLANSRFFPEAETQ